MRKFWKVILNIIAIGILCVVIAETFTADKKNIYYLFAIAGIVVVGIFINNLEKTVKEILVYFNLNQTWLSRLIRQQHKHSTGLINIYTIVFSFLIITFFTTKITGLNSPNKEERAIWSIYNTSISALNNFELIFDMDTNDLLNKNNEEDITEKLQNYISKISDDEINIKSNIGIDRNYLKEDLFVMTMEDLKEDTEFIMSTYISYLDDQLYKSIAQINRDVSLYEFTNENKISDYDINIFSAYISKLIIQLSDVNEKWYGYYLPEIKQYNEENLDIYQIKSDKSLRKERIEKGLIIEELCNNIDTLNNKKEKVEIIYRMIENEKIFPNEEDAKKIMTALDSEFDSMFIKKK